VSVIRQSHRHIKSEHLESADLRYGSALRIKGPAPLRIRMTWSWRQTY